MKLTLIAGARPNFMKIAPIIHVIEKLIGINPNQIKPAFDRLFNGE